MKAWGVTDVGLKRQENQDSYALETQEPFVSAVVCDGMGGVSGGKLASMVAVSAYMDALRALLSPEMTPEQLCEAQRACVSWANRAVFERSRESEEYFGMGTTLVSVIASGETAVIANVGDSRAYLIHEDGIRRVSRDHSLVAEMIASGDLTPEQARTHPSRNLITRALGPDDEISCDTYIVPFAIGDCLLLCTDGVTETATDEELMNIARLSEDGATALSRLLELAKSRGAPDNVTAVLIRNDAEEVAAVE